jgi:hypothetical protein
MRAQPRGRLLQPELAFERVPRPSWSVPSGVSVLLRELGRKPAVEILVASVEPKQIVQVRTLDCGKALDRLAEDQARKDNGVVRHRGAQLPMVQSHRFILPIPAASARLAASVHCLYGLVDAANPHTRADRSRAPARHPVGPQLARGEDRAF